MTQGATRPVYLWDIAAKSITTLTVSARLGAPGRPATQGYLPMALDAAGTALALSDGTKTHFYSVPAKRQTGTLPAGMAALSPDGTLMAAIGTHHDIQLWNVAAAKVVATLTAPHESSAPSAVAFSVNGKSLAAGYKDGRSAVWNLAGG